MASLPWLVGLDERSLDEREKKSDLLGWRGEIRMFGGLQDTSLRQSSLSPLAIHNLNVTYFLVSSSCTFPCQQMSAVFVSYLI